MSISDRLRAVIGDATIDEFAELLGEPPSRVKDVLRNKQRPPMDMLIKLRTIQGVDLNWLATGEGQYKPALGADEARLLVAYRALPEKAQDALMSMASALSVPNIPMKTYSVGPAAQPVAIHEAQPKGSPVEGRSEMTFHGPVGQVSHGDTTINGGVSMSVADNKKPPATKTKSRK